MRLTEIKLNVELWPRNCEDKETVDHYAEIFEELPPIVVQRGTGKLIDGWHRWHAASKLGLTEVEVEEVEIADNLVFADAVKRNLKHGLPLKRQERDKAILRLRDADFSTYQIASVLGCHQSTVSLVLKASKVQGTNNEYSSLPLLHRVSIANAPPAKHPEIAKAVAKKKLTEKEIKMLVEAISSPTVTDEDRNAMLHDPVTRPYLRDEKGEQASPFLRRGL